MLYKFINIFPFVWICNLMTYEITLPNIDIYRVYGLFFLLPTSAGNVPGQKGWLLFSILVTGTFCFAPFAGLMIYNEGIPHDNISTNKHSIICPGDAFTLLNPNVSMFDLLPDGASLKMDDQCKRLRDWCSDHKEAQGKYVDSNPKIFSEQEFDKCVDFLDTEVPNFFYFMSGQPCEDIWDCQVGGHIGKYCWTRRIRAPVLRFEMPLNYVAVKNAITVSPVILMHIILQASAVWKR